MLRTVEDWIPEHRTFGTRAGGRLSLTSEFLTHTPLPTYQQPLRHVTEDMNERRGAAMSNTFLMWNMGHLPLWSCHPVVIGPISHGGLQEASQPHC